MQDIAVYIDHTILKPVTTAQDVRQLCSEAIAHGFAAVCVPPYYVALAHELLTGTAVKVGTVIGFPLGYSAIDAKVTEIAIAINNGADELDVVHNIAALKNGDWEHLQKEIAACTQLVHSKLCSIKIIIETAYLADEEIIKCCELYAPIGVDFMKTSTGFADAGATVHAVSLMRAHLPGNISIKASGGIRTFAFAQELIAAGATRIGTSSGIGIVKESKEA